jgi:hypothetical protein
VIPGLLQTTDYVSALFEVGPHDARSRQRIDLKAARQERIMQTGGPELGMIIDEAALRRQIGGPAVMRRQLGYCSAPSRALTNAMASRHAQR